MRIILVTTLILGCLTASFAALYGELFEYYDSQGRCWRCLPGLACRRCQFGISPLENFPSNWSRACPPPQYGVECLNFPGAKFPSLNINFYWICADGEVALAQCFCDMAFDMRAQQCVKAEDLSSIGCTPYDHSDIMTCDAGGNPGVPPTAPPVDPPTPQPPPPTAPPNGSPTDPPTPQPPPPTAPPNGSPTDPPTPQPPPPTAPPNGPPTDPPTPQPPPPTDPPTAPPIDPPTPQPPTPQPPPNIPTRTTEDSGAGVTNPGITPSEPSNTTPPPCVCVVWWPCWCNPCWNMPCHSCHGCVGMK